MLNQTSHLKHIIKYTINYTHLYTSLSTSDATTTCSSTGGENPKYLNSRYNKMYKHYLYKSTHPFDNRFVLDSNNWFDDNFFFDSSNLLLLTGWRFLR